MLRGRAAGASRSTAKLIQRGDWRADTRDRARGQREAGRIWKHGRHLEHCTPAGRGGNPGVAVS
ncbi:hypothetical protein CGRA01v4_01873 [Colletotrichum graminicola]|nr:hypothetical protein CGRA01v4_01873 [Colletotrichum graminicola]